ncbi:hypothetical protein CCACVL1_19600 [Corchorus capsularis]|uniref:MGRN1/RNF157-like N-terminal domain-containing protein n=1 Tax=Corchorus capsularis TaxID=210143 RepID=A0A1R3HFZ0_COCAP|nr:hypothetical protein CCACVL1_19600 [Corchorus capsularis]
MSSHAQITQAVLKKNNEEHFQVQVIKQILRIEGIRYELRIIYAPVSASLFSFSPFSSSTLALSLPTVGEARA